MSTALSKELLQSAQRAHQAGRLHEAARLYDQALRYDAANFAAAANLGVLLGEVREYAQAEALLRRLVGQAPKYADGFAALASVLHDQERFAEAIAVCEQGLATAANHRKLLNTLASSLGGAGRYEEAVELLARIVRAHPGFAQGHEMLGKLHTKLGRIDAAIAAFDAATKANPRDAATFVTAGEVLLVHGRAADALPRLESGLKLNPYDVRGLALKLLALAEVGRTDDERWLGDPETLIQPHRIADTGYSVEDIAALNRALSEVASSEPSLKEDPPQYATFKAWHSTTNIAEIAHPAFDALKKFIAHAFDARRRGLDALDPAHPFVRAVPPAYHLDMWVIRIREGGGQLLPHIHCDGWLSGVYYVDVPAVVDDPGANEAGWIKFGAPRSDIKLTRPTITRTVKPEPGLMLTFPSYMWHDTIPLPPGNTEQRLCIAFDFHPRPGPAGV
jgi:tetratricopeptide (TPR) repeat protein